MKISQRLREQEITVSCELFPPKEGNKLSEYKAIAREVAALNPSFISVTYGASGGTSEYTAQVAREVYDTLRAWDAELERGRDDADVSRSDAPTAPAKKDPAEKG